LKSSEIKNWRYELSYKEIVSLEDFDELLTQAIAQESCLGCGGDRILSDGLCIGCSMMTRRQDRKISDYLLRNVKVYIQVKLPKKLY